MRRTLPLEALVVGALTVFVFYFIKFIFKNIINLTLVLFLTGAFLHLSFEALGWNESWCRATFKVL